MEKEIIAGISLNSAYAFVLIYLGLAGVHALVARYHLLKQMRRLALYGGLITLCYLLLAILHGVVH